MNNRYFEVVNDFTDDDGFTHIDVYLDEEETGKTVAIVCQDTGKVFFIDRDYYNSTAVLEAIEEVKPKIKSKTKYNNDEAFRRLKEQADKFKNTLILYLFEVVRLVDIVQDEDDFYWVFEKSNGEVQHVSCLIEWIPLKSLLKDKQYERLKSFWNLNLANKCI